MSDRSAPKAPDFARNISGGMIVIVLTIAVSIFMLVFGVVGLASPLGEGKGQLGIPEKIFCAFVLAGGVSVLSATVQRILPRFGNPFSPLLLGVAFSAIGILTFMAGELIEHI